MNTWQEAGSQNVRNVTARVSKFSKWNYHRDLFRYIRVPVDIVEVDCPVLESPGIMEKVVEKPLPMIDPHELLEYLHCSGRLKVDKAEIARLPFN